MVFSYSLSAKSSSPRVAVWRQLNRLGALSPVGGVYLLPARDRCVEAFGWLAQQVRQAGGEALLMHVDRFEGITDQAMIARFREVRQADYTALGEQVERLETALRAADTPTARQEIKSELDRMQQALADITDIDYFACPERDQLTARLARVRLAIFPDLSAPVEIARVEVDAYHGAQWVTRPHPHVDRLACAWLIRRFVDPDATIRYAPEPQDGGDTPYRGEVPFDVPGADFSHRGSLCTFEVMLRTFGLVDPALQALAEIVHEIDVRDGVSARPETGGVDALLRGWQLSAVPDAEMERRGIELFEGLYAALCGSMPSSCELGGDPT
ncbi:MAG: chromate resistance protein [Anaerolineae bacterium]|nr:chromate resistance protein [Anaerolineae bacterium]